MQCDATKREVKGTNPMEFPLMPRPVPGIVWPVRYPLYYCRQASRVMTYYDHYYCFKAKLGRRTAIWSSPALCKSLSPEAEDVGKQSENFMSSPAVIDFSQPIRPWQRQKKYQEIVICGKKNLIK